MNAKEAYPRSLGRPESVSDLTRYAVTAPEMAVSASKLHSYTCCLNRLMALETDEGNMIHDVSSGILKYILLIRELLYSISCKVHSMPFPDFCFDCEL